MVTDYNVKLSTDATQANFVIDDFSFPSGAGLRSYGEPFVVVWEYLSDGGPIITAHTYQWRTGELCVYHDNRWGLIKHIPSALNILEPMDSRCRVIAVVERQQQ